MKPSAPRARAAHPEVLGLWGFVTLLVGWCVAYVSPVDIRVPEPYNWYGFTLGFLMGTLLSFSAMRALGKADPDYDPRSPDRHLPRPRRLVTTGPYAFTRHPFILGRALQLGGTALLFGSVVTAVVTCVLWVGTWWVRFAGPEERELERKYGQAYRDYACRTAFLIPGLVWPWRRG